MELLLRLTPQELVSRRSFFDSSWSSYSCSLARWWRAAGTPAHSCVSTQLTRASVTIWQSTSRSSPHSHSSMRPITWDLSPSAAAFLSVLPAFNPHRPRPPRISAPSF